MGYAPSHICITKILSCVLLGSPAHGWKACEHGSQEKMTKGKVSTGKSCCCCTEGFLGHFLEDLCPKFFSSHGLDI